MNENISALMTHTISSQSLLANARTSVYWARQVAQSINSKVFINIDKNLKVFDSGTIIMFPDMHITAKESDLITSKYSICEDMSLVCDAFIYEKLKNIFHYHINDDYNIISIYGTSIKPKRIINNISEEKCLKIKYKIQTLNNALTESIIESIRF